ncbi:UvrD-helicase domain-containing protein [uncultured Slackia sp.]|uniref:HelD family protein n=1 Tax=uncultured Slackia sp. TaxID=665903 RepID=UPI0026E05CE3|nr:UvrD-helicase domain-containing protein [uncultured Slackia sp.]
MFTDPAQPNLPRTASDQTPPACDQDERTDDPILVEERRHLSETYAKLEAMEQALVAKIKKLDDDVAADKEMLADELTGNFASMGEAFETYAEFASANKTIDLYNATQELNFQNLQKVRLLMHQPYFAKVALQFKPGDAPKELYIGNAGISDDDYKRLVVDWRSPVAEVYYNQENGPTSYKANGRTIDVDLKLRRQFDIEADRLNAYFDTTVAIQDAMLLASLSQERSSHMKAITATIQKEQNEVIRHEDVDVLLVNGIAGSGKTSVLMQRIAYLFYQHRETLKPEEVCLITPNPVFSRYIEQVLPDLGESNPETMTFDQFMASVMPADRSRGRADISPDALARIDEAVRGLAFDPDDFKDIVCDGTQLISAGQIRQAADKFRRIPAGPHLVTLMREELHKRLENRLRQMAATERAQNEATSLSVQEQVRIFHETIAPQTDAELRECTLTYLHDRYAAAFDIVERDEWLRIDRIGMRILGAEGLLPVEWVYLKMAVSGMGDASVKYVMVDEVQDYTCAQLMVLRRYFRRARFLLLGDENQAIKDHTASFAEIKSVFERAGSEVQECRLLTSYRSSPQITELFTKLMPKGDRMRVSSVQHERAEPRIAAFNDEGAYEDALRDAVAQARGMAGLTAVIADSRTSLKRVRSILGENAPAVISDDATLPASGVVLMTLEFAKGLEFDQVIIPDARAEVFGDGRVARNRLYTSISRATGRIVILAPGALTPLLD